jgi:outer membrane protein assembly factor BamB
MVAAALACATSLAATSLPADAATYNDSTAYQISSRHDGVASGTALRQNLVRAWSKDLGGRVSYPVIAGGRVFVTVAHTTSYGSDLYAFDARTGAVDWGPINLGGTYFLSGLTYEKGRVFAVNYDGVMRAFNAATGAQTWSVQLPGQWAFTSAPTAEGGTVYTSGAGGGGTLYAVDEATGAVKWTVAVANGDHSSPTVNATSVFVSYACETTYRFSLTGSLVWNHTTGCSGGGGRTAVLHGGELWVRDDAGMTPVVLSAKTGQAIRTFTSQTAPAFADGSALLMQTDGLTAIDASTGRTRWAQSGDGQLASAPVISGAVAYVGSGSGTVYGYNIRTGARVWAADAGAPVLTPDEHNAWMLQGLAIGDGVLAVPATTRLTVFH